MLFFWPRDGSRPAGGAGPVSLNSEEVWRRFNTPGSPASRGRRISYLRALRAYPATVPCIEYVYRSVRPDGFLGRSGNRVREEVIRFEGM